jgi:ribosomal protein L28
MQKKRLYSEALDETVQFNTTAHALRCIDKAGGLDNYLKALKPTDLKTERLQHIRQSIIAAEAQKSSAR